MTNDKDFSFDRLDQLAKACADTIKADGKVSTDEFLAVIKEIRKIFDVLGSIVSLAFQDIDKKIGEIKDAKTVIGDGGKCDGGDDLWSILDAEYALQEQYKPQYEAGTLSKDDWKAKYKMIRGGGATRAISRMILVANMMSDLLKDLLVNKTKEVSKALGECYPETLGKVHNTTAYYAFTGCLMWLPYRKDFIKKLNADEDMVGKLVPTITQNCDVIRDAIRNRFENNYQVEWFFK